MIKKIFSIIAAIVVASFFFLTAAISGGVVFPLVFPALNNYECELLGVFSLMLTLAIIYLDVYLNK